MVTPLHVFDAEYLRNGTRYGDTDTDRRPT